MFLTIGVCGGFTTFSTFSMDTVLLATREAMVESAFYVVASVTFSIAALYAGLLAVRAVL